MDPLWFDARLYAADAREVFENATRLASGTASSSTSSDGKTGGVGVEHVACAVFCEHPVGLRCLAGLSPDKIKILQSDLKSSLGKCERSDQKRDFFLRCVRAQRPSFGPKNLEDVILAIFEPAFNLGPMFAQHGLTLEVLRDVLPKAFQGAVAHTEGQGANRMEPAVAPKPKASQAATASPKKAAKPEPSLEERRETPALAAFGVDLVEQAKMGKLDPVVGRDAEITRVLQILARRTKNNVCLIGAPGVGKTAMAEAVAQRIATGRVPVQLRHCRSLWSLDIGALLAGTGLRGDFEERLQMILAEVRGAQDTMLLFIDELHLILGAGRSENNNVDAANLMKPMLARGEVRCIGATTADEYKRLILAKDAAFERRFAPVELNEPSLEAALEMLSVLGPLYASHHGVEVSSSALEGAVQLSSARIKGRSLPDKAIDVLDEACCFATARGESVVTLTHVESVISQWRAPPWQREQGPLHATFSWLRGIWSRL